METPADESTTKRKRQRKQAADKTVKRRKTEEQAILSSFLPRHDYCGNWLPTMSRITDGVGWDAGKTKLLSINGAVAACCWSAAEHLTTTSDEQYLTEAKSRSFSALAGVAVLRARRLVLFFFSLVCHYYSIVSLWRQIPFMTPYTITIIDNGKCYS